MSRGLCKNSFLPKQSTDGYDGVRKGGLGFGIPLWATQPDGVTPRMLGKNQTHDTEQPQQTRSGTQDRLGRILSRRFKTQMTTHLLKRRLDRPTRGEPTDDLFRPEAGVRTVYIFVPMCSLDIMDKNPPHRNQSFADFVPEAGATDQLDPAVRSAIPTYRRGSPWAVRHHLLGGGQLSVFSASVKKIRIFQEERQAWEWVTSFSWSI